MSWQNRRARRNYAWICKWVMPRRTIGPRNAQSRSSSHQFLLLRLGSLDTAPLGYSEASTARLSRSTPCMASAALTKVKCENAWRKLPAIRFSRCVLFAQQPEFVGKPDQLVHEDSCLGPSTSAGILLQARRSKRGKDVHPALGRRLHSLRGNAVRYRPR
jgi:hypothetical protein